MLTARDALRLTWIEKLESGEYKQTKHRLALATTVFGGQEVAFCCLGVLCDLKKTETLTWKYEPFLGLTFSGAQTALPLFLQDEIGLTKEETEDLMGMNDEGASFVQIAKFLRQKWGL